MRGPEHFVFLVTCGLVLGAGTSVAAQETVTYYHTDGIGSVRVVTDAAGNLLQNRDYLPFGEPWPSTPPFERRGFAGMEKDPETTLNYVGARYYTSGSGRFTSVDPLLNIDAALTDPQRWNRFAHARNNPMVFVDPDGRDIRLAIGPQQQEWMKKAGAFRDWVATALGADAPGSEHSLGVLGRNVIDSLLASVLPRDLSEAADAGNAAIVGIAGPLEVGAARAIARLKPIGLPAWRSIGIDMEEVISGHTSSGLRAVQSGIKSLFPDAMSQKQIESAVRNAYRYGKKVGTQGDRVKMRGPWDGGTLELWLNTTTKTIESAYPIP